jgi:hypothetical protein
LINRALAAVWQLGRAGKVPAIQEIEFFANDDDTQLLSEVYCLPETASLAEHFTDELKATLAAVSGVSFFVARSAKGEGRGEPRLLGGTGIASLIYATQLASYRVSAGSLFPDGARRGTPTGQPAGTPALLGQPLISMLGLGFFLLS